MILIIGYGNTLRRDDGGGVALAKKLHQIWHEQQLHVQIIIVHQLVPELAQDIAHEDVSTVVFVDTRIIDSCMDNHGIEIQPISLQDSSPASNHYMTATTLMTYAHFLYNAHAVALQVTVPGHDFGYGEIFSDITQQALDNLPDSVYTLF